MIRRFRFLGRAACFVALTLSCGLAIGCGGANKESVTAKTAASTTPEQIDADPVALLPGSPVAAVHVDARAVLGTPYGESLGRMIDKNMPIGEDAGFLASRDVDAIWGGWYTAQGIHGLSVLRGRFDEKKLEEAAEKKTQTKGGMVVKSIYAERNVYTVANVGIVVLTSKTALVGTETTIRQSLDRIRDGRLQRSVPGWMLETISTAGAAIAIAADFETQPMPAEVKAQIPLGWLRNVKTAKIVATPESGMRVNAHLAYGSPDEAQGAERGLRQAQTLASALAITGAVPKIQDSEMKTEGNDVDCSFRVDERGLTTLLSSAQRWLGT